MRDYRSVGRTYPVEMRYRPIEQREDEDDHRQSDWHAMRPKGQGQGTALDETSDDLQNAILDAVMNCTGTCAVIY